MHASLPFRARWFIVVPLLALPLLGQDCETCPPPDNPCQQAIQVISGGVSECGVRDRPDGYVCDNGGVTGICSNGLCGTNECAGNESYGICDNPVDRAELEPEVGACVEDLCVAAVPYDECVKVGVGRMNCCTQDGCKAASGAFCNQPLENGTSCDTSGVKAAGGPGLDGLCVDGACVAQTGLCQDVECRTTRARPCVRRYCDADVGLCAEWALELFPRCVTSDGFAGVCNGGSCLRILPDDECECDDGNSCTENVCVGEFCYFRPRETGEPCLDGESGQCYRRGESASCFPLLEFCDEGNDQSCDDGNECTADTCELTCRNRPLDDGTSCASGFGLCRAGVCVPDLCIDRDCGDPDANSCTGVCISPYGICDDDAPLANGTSCDGNGQCLNGFCQPILTAECTHNPFDPDRDAPECDDGKECTYDRCDFASQCYNPRKPDGTSCNNGNGSCIFGGCALNPPGGGIGF
jgi:hypothetical protein